MIFISYLDIYDIKYDDEGNSFEYPKIKNATIPINIEKTNIEIIKPFISNKGKIFKHVSVITDSGDRNFKVYGNYKKIIKKVYGIKNKNLGFSG